MINQAVSLNLSAQELVLITNALNEIINGPDAIASAEFQTRTGIGINEARALLSRMTAKIESLNAL
jgi:hypothetical protein